MSNYDFLHPTEPNTEGQSEPEIHFDRRESFDEMQKALKRLDRSAKRHRIYTFIGFFTLVASVLSILSFFGITLR